MDSVCVGTLAPYLGDLLGLTIDYLKSHIQDNIHIMRMRLSFSARPSGG